MMKIDFDFWDRIKGFMDKDEALRLYQISQLAAVLGPVLEIGSYCGKSAYIIGTACREKDSILFSIDHHQGSEEQQPGEEYFDPDLLDDRTQGINTFPFFRETLRRAGLERTVVPVVSASATVGKMWGTPLSMLFIDGGHSFEAVCTDYRTWACHIQSKGYLVIHDIFTDPEKGGQAPCQVYELALKSGQFKELEMTKTLGVLEKR